MSAMPMVHISDVKMSKNPVSVNEKFKIAVKILELTPDKGFRLPLKLGNKEEK
ncbi:MAG: hypothetical protein ACLRPH_00835 [Ruminococcus sp.]